MLARSSMKERPICLIQPPTSFGLRAESIFYDVFDSIGLISLAGFLRQKGLRVELFNIARAHRYGYSVEQVAERIRSCNPLIVGIGGMWLHQSAGALEVAQIVRRIHPDVPVVVGGQHASLFARELVEDYGDVIDAVVVGEGEEAVSHAVGSLLSQGRPDWGLPGIMSIDDCGKLSCDPASVTLDIDTLPFLSYRDVWPQAGSSCHDPYHDIAALNTCRGGCPCACCHCLEAPPFGAMGRPRRARHSVDYLIEQIKLFILEGKTNLFIQDAFFSGGDAFVAEFVGRARREDLKLTRIHFFVEPGFLSRDTLRCLAAFPADLVKIDYGVETGSEQVARNLNRYSDYSEIFDDLSTLGQTCALATAWWLVGLPGETEECLLETEQAIKRAIDRGVYPERISQMILFPGTGLYSRREEFGITPFFQNYRDFCLFSRIERRPDGIYPELITHEMPYQRKDDTIRFLNRIKRQIGNWLEEHQSCRGSAVPSYTFKRYAFF